MGFFKHFFQRFNQWKIYFNFFPEQKLFLEFFLGAVFAVFFKKNSFLGKYFLILENNWNKNVDRMVNSVLEKRKQFKSIGNLQK